MGYRFGNHVVTHTVILDCGPACTVSKGRVTFLSLILNHCFVNSTKLVGMQDMFVLSYGLHSSGLHYHIQVLRRWFRCVGDLGRCSSVETVQRVHTTVYLCLTQVQI